MSELKPCPICGHTKIEEHYENVDVGDPYANITNCIFECRECNYTRGADTREEAIRRWNTRPAEDALKAENGRLKEALSDMCTLWEALGTSVPLVLNEQKYLNVKTLLTKDTPEKGGEDE